MQNLYSIGLNEVCFLNDLSYKGKETKIIFIECIKGNNCGLITEGLFEIQSQIMNVIFLKVFLNDWSFERFLFDINYGRTNDEIS